MTLAEISIRRPVFAWMLMIALILFGAIAFQDMGISQLPDVDFPMISVSVDYEGAAPEIIETDIVDPIEGALMTVEGVRSISASARYGSANVTVEFDLDRNIDLALQDVQAKVSQVQRRLPKDVEAPVVSKTNPEDQPIMWIGLEVPNVSRRELMMLVRDRVQDQFATIPGVGEVFVGGYVEPNLRIWVDEKKLEQYALTVTDVIGTIQNEHAEPPAGKLEAGPKEYNLRTIGEAGTVREFENLRLSARGGQPIFTDIRLKQVARVEEGLADIRRISRKDGRPGVGMGIRKQRGSNAVGVANAVRQKLPRIEKMLPQGSKLDVVFDSTRFIEESVHELNFTLVLSALLTSIVCWVFLGSWSSTLNVLLAIPTSIVGTFIFISFMGFTLNMFTLLALSLAIGIVVDDAIMVLENITKHREMGKERRKAALDGAIEITFAAVAATVSIAAIFLPIAFMKGVIGKFLFQFGVTITIAVFLSLLEALTLTPMRAAGFGAQEHERSGPVGRAFETGMHHLIQWYQGSLKLALKWRWLIILASVGIFALSLFTAGRLNREMLPQEDQSRFMIRVQTPVGSSLEFTDEVMKKVEAFLQSRPEVSRFMMSVGGMGGGDVNSGMTFVTMKPKGERDISQFDLMSAARKELSKIPSAKVVVQDLSMRGFTASRGFPIEFTIRGAEWDQLSGSAARIMKEMEATGLMTDIDTDYKEGMPEIRVIPDRDAASLRGVSISTIGQTVNALLGGVVVGRYSTGGHRYDIRVKMQESKEDRRERLRRLHVRNNRGELIPLTDVVQVQEKPALQAISRRDRQRAVTVFANVARGVSQQRVIESVNQIGSKVLPEGYRIAWSGGTESFKESFNSLIFALVLGLVVAYMVLGSQFNSFIHPVTVLMALPFAITGAFIALLITGQSLNLYSMIGLILLMGIVKKNSILLVDFTNQTLEETHNAEKALLIACPGRLRPILMTSIATVVGAIPAAIAFGPGAEARAPMAIAVIGGVIVSTFLTLYVVPCVYSVFAKFSR